MARQITGEAAGSPDFSTPGRYRIGRLRSDAVLHFTDELAKNGVEEENISGLPTNRIIITSITINGKELRKYRVSFWSKDTFSSSTLNDDTFLGSAIIDLTKYRATAVTLL